MILVLTAVSALVPSILLAWYFYSRDLRPEPARAVWATFGLGVLSIAPTLLADWPINKLFVSHLAHPLVTGPAEAFLVAAIPEEFFKFAVLYWYARRRRWFDEPMDGVVYGAIASLGFATLENILYCLQGSIVTAIMRAVTSVPGHAFWGAMMGYFVGVAHFSPAAARPRLVLHALAWPILLHGVYDTGLLTLKAYGERMLEPAGGALAMVVVLLVLSLAAVILSWVFGIRLTRRMRRAQVLALAAAGGPPGAVGPAVAALAAIWPKDAGVGDLPVPPVPPKASRPLAWLFLILGGLLCGGGALMLLGVALSATRDKIGGAIGAGLLFGVLPIGLGLWLFSRGLRRLPKRVRASRVPPPPAPVPAAGGLGAG